MYRLLIIACLVLAAPVHAGASESDRDALRAQFTDALANARAGRTPTSVVDDALRDYPLYPYLEAARLQHAIELGRTDVAAAVQRFLENHTGEPVTQPLRRAWLRQLAKSRDWPTFLQVYGADAGSDGALACEAVRGRIALGADAEEIAPLAIERWLTPRSAPDSCDPVFDWLRASGRLSPALIEQRARLALAEGETRLARWLAKSLPDSEAAPLLAWAALLEQPRATIDRLIAEPGLSIEPEALEAGWTRLARRETDAAITRYDALVKRAPDPAAARSRYARPIALALAWSRRPEALEFFGRVAPEDYDDSTHEWHARAALWAGDWAQVDRVIAGMPDTLREQNRWRYWSARASEQLGATERARVLYESVVPTDNYYALQAAARLERRYTPVLEPIPLNEDGIDAVAAISGFARAGELLAIAEPVLATREWRQAYEQLGDEQRVHAVGLAARWGWHFQAIATAAGLALYNDYPLLYPKPFAAEVRNAAQVTGLPDALIFAVIRQESLYQPYAVSSAGAIGLMQLLPSTAALSARALQVRRPSRADLKEPAINVKLGAATLQGLVARFAGQTELALAGYNAGPGAARRWLPERALDADVWIENVPFNETRAYVQRVLWHSVVFAWLDGREPQDVSNLLARIDSATETVAGNRVSAE